MQRFQLAIKKRQERIGRIMGNSINTKKNRQYYAMDCNDKRNAKLNSWISERRLHDKTNYA